MKSCCVTGHRNIPYEKIKYVIKELRREILLAIKDGHTHFISGFADGADLIFSDIVTEMKAEHPNITLEAAIPYRKRLHTKSNTFQRLIELCDKVTVVSENYVKGCYNLRNIYMLKNADRVIGVYDGRESGGTAFTIRNAFVAGKEVRIIRVNEWTPFVTLSGARVCGFPRKL